MASAVNRLRSGNVSIGVDEAGFLLVLHSSGLVHCLTLIHHHGVGAGSSRDDHSGKGASSLDTLVVHNVLGVVLLHCLTIGIFKAIRLHNSGLGGEIVSSSSFVS